MELGRAALGRRRDPLHELDDDAVRVLDRRVRALTAAGTAILTPIGTEERGEGYFQVASRIGTTAGHAHGRAHDPDLAYAFGLVRIADGVQALRHRTAEA